jgi:hypothetical protein
MGADPESSTQKEILCFVATQSKGGPGFDTVILVSVQSKLDRFDIASTKHSIHAEGRVGQSEASKRNLHSILENRDNFVRHCLDELELGNFKMKVLVTISRGHFWRTLSICIMFIRRCNS